MNRFQVGQRVMLCWGDSIVKQDCEVIHVDEYEGLVFLDSERFGFDIETGDQDRDPSYYIEEQ